ncbi:MAG: hypothetical protein WAW42_20770 [Candidatus Competibacteraceae bacterium]
MIKNLKLRTQLNLGFTAVIALLVIVAGTAYWGLNSALEALPNIVGRLSTVIGSANFRARC